MGLKDSEWPTPYAGQSHKWDRCQIHACMYGKKADLRCGDSAEVLSRKLSQ